MHDEFDKVHLFAIVAVEAVDVLGNATLGFFVHRVTSLDCSDAVGVYSFP